MSIVLESRASKAEILELYLNDVYLGQRGSFAIHGVAEAARLFFGKDVTNLTISEAALIAGVIQSPASRSPFTNPQRAMERRNVVISAMEGEEFITAARRPAPAANRCRWSPGRSTTKRPISSTWSGAGRRRISGGHGAPGHAQRLHDARPEHAAGGARRRAARPHPGRRDAGATETQEQAQAALLAVDPKTGEILAMVGGRSYNQSQFNRALTRDASRDRCSSRSSFSPPSNGRRGRAHRLHAGIDRERRAEVFEFDGSLGA